MEEMQLDIFEIIELEPETKNTSKLTFHKTENVFDSLVAHRKNSIEDLTEKSGRLNWRNLNLKLDRSHMLILNIVLFGLLGLHWNDQHLTLLFWMLFYQ